MFEKSFEEIELSPYKWISHIDKLKILSENGDVYPVTVELDLAGFCNHSCGWCVDPQHIETCMESSFVSILLDELQEIGVEGIVFKGGGEGTLHPDYSEILKLTKDKKFEIGIITNGSKLNELILPIVQNASYIRISIDGPTPELHKKIHGSNDFNEVIDGVRNITRQKSMLKKRHPVIGLSFAMDYSMRNNIEDAIMLGDSLGVDYVLLRPPFFEEVGKQNTMTAQQKIELLTAFEAGKKAYNGKMKIYIDYWISNSESGQISLNGDSMRRGKLLQNGMNGIEHITGTCLASPLLAVITADKKVYPCCNLRLIEEWCIGTLDYTKGNTFKKIWQSDNRKTVMDKIHSINCIKYCTHPLSRYNEIIDYLKGPQFHRGFL